MNHSFEDITNSEIRYLIDEYIHSERDRVILKRIYADKIHYEPLADELELSVSTISRTYKKYKPLMDTLLQ